MVCMCVYSGKSRSVRLEGEYVKGGDGGLKTKKQDMGSKLGLWNLPSRSVEAVESLCKRTYVLG